MTTSYYFITNKFIYQKTDILNDYLFFFWEKKWDYWFWTKQYLWSKFFMLNRPLAIYIWDAFHYGLYKRFFLCSLIFFLIIIIFILIFKLFKFMIKSFFYHYLFEIHYSILYRTHPFYYFVNPRGYFNYSVFWKKYVMTMSEKKLREDFLSTLDSVDSRLIYNRIKEYISLLEKRETTGDYYMEEKQLIQSQISYASELLISLQMFYRSGGFYTDVWMSRYKFFENYEFYCECSFFYPVILLEIKHLISIFNENWSQFIINLSYVQEVSQFQDLLLLVNKIKAKDVSNLTYEDIDLLKETLLKDFSFYDLNFINLKIYYSFFKLFFLYSKISYLNDTLFICSEVIANYPFYVDNIIKFLLNRDAEFKMIRYVRGLRADAKWEGYRLFWKNLLFFPMQNFLNNFLFFLVSKAVKILKINLFIEKFNKWKYAKTLKKIFKKLQKRDFEYFKALLKKWLDSKI